MTTLHGRILVIDDNPVSARVVTARLEKAGHEVATAADAEAAIAALSEMGADALIADLGVAGGNGLQVVSEIRSQPEWNALPVLVTSSVADAAIVREAGARGVRRFFLKPLDGEALLGEIQDLLREEHRLTLLSPTAAWSALSLDLEQYQALLGELADLVQQADSQLVALSSDDPQDDAMSRAIEALRRIADVVETVSSGPFLALGTDDRGATAERPSIDDWRRVALRDLRLLQAQIDVILGAELAAADAPPAAEAAPAEAAPAAPSTESGEGEAAEEPGA